jgi:hypothetical protein
MQLAPVTLGIQGAEFSSASCPRHLVSLPVPAGGGEPDPRDRRSACRGTAGSECRSMACRAENLVKWGEAMKLESAGEPE